MNCSDVAPVRKLFTPVGHIGIMWFCAAAIPIISLIGIIGNILTCVILKESSRHAASHLYFFCLAVFDTLALLANLFSYYKVLVLQPLLVLLRPTSFTFIDYLSFPVLCKLRTFLSFSFRFMSIYTIVVLTVERCLLMAFPLRLNRHGLAGSIGNIKAARIAMLSLVIGSLVISVPWLLSFNEVIVPCSNGLVNCVPNRTMYMTRFVEFILFSIVPAIVLIACNSYIVHVMRKQDRQSRGATWNRIDQSEQPQRSGDRVTGESGETGGNANDSPPVAASRNKTVTIQLVTISSAFVALTLPSMLVISVSTWLKMRGSRALYVSPVADLFHLSMVLFIGNLACNFFLYCLTGRLFRRAFFALICGRYAEMAHYRTRISEEATAGSIVSERRGSSSSRVSRASGRRSGGGASRGDGRRGSASGASSLPLTGFSPAVVPPQPTAASALTDATTATTTATTPETATASSDAIKTAAALLQPSAVQSVPLTRKDHQILMENELRLEELNGQREAKAWRNVRLLPAIRHRYGIDSSFESSSSSSSYFLTDNSSSDTSVQFTLRAIPGPIVYNFSRFRRPFIHEIAVSIDENINKGSADKESTEKEKTIRESTETEPIETEPIEMESTEKESTEKESTEKESTEKESNDKKGFVIDSSETKASLGA